jgi:RNA polymerase sigma-32 factor
MRDNDMDRLAMVSGLDREKLEKLLPVISASESSLDAESSEGQSISDRVKADGPSPEDEAEKNEEEDRASAQIRCAMQSLSDRERFIVRERMMAEDPITLQALGDLLGVSKERVRQLEERARGKLRERLQEFRKCG